MSDAELNQRPDAEAVYASSATEGSGPVAVSAKSPGSASERTRSASPAERAVRRAHETFIKAVEEVLRGNPAPMSELWIHSPTVTCAHPVGHWALGWEQVWTDWVEIASLTTDGEVSVKNLQVRIYGTTAYTTYSEQIRISFQDQVVVVPANVTNIYVLTPGEGPTDSASSDGSDGSQGAWKLVHHHADRSNAAERVVDLLID